jgi:hypothetical protein
MATLTPQQRTALGLIARATIDAVQAAGPDGAPAGVLYAALMQQGCTLSQFQSLMGALVRTGKLRAEGDLYFVASGAGNAAV